MDEGQKTVKRRLSEQFVLLVASCFLPGASLAGTITFDTGATTGALSEVVTGSYSEDGLTMTHVDSGYQPRNSHWDRFRGYHGATVLDNSAGIHMGNNGEEVLFTSAGGYFDLLSIDIEEIFQGTGPSTSSITGVFTSSLGAVLNTSAEGTVSFAGLAGWTGITSFTFSMPFGTGDCAVGGTDCSGMVFDNISFSASVPEPPVYLSLISFLLILARFRKSFALRL